MKRKYGWAIFAPESFEVFEDGDNRIALFRGVEPPRMILVHWIDDYGRELTPEASGIHLSGQEAPVDRAAALC